MRTKVKLQAAVLLSMAVVLSACHKKKSDQPQQDAQTVSGQVALNIAKTLYGSFGGLDLADSLSEKTPAAAARRAIMLNTIKSKIHSRATNSGCGLSIDSVINTTTIGNTTTSVKGNITLGILCNKDSIPSGISFLEDLNIQSGAGKPSLFYTINEKLTIQPTDLQNEDSDILLNGTATLSSADQLNGKNDTESYSYTFKALTIDNNGALKGGSATFQTSGKKSNSEWSYSGTIVFISKDQVKITINGKIYTVNTSTGKVS